MPNREGQFGAAVLHLPVRALASWDIGSSLTPYLGAGYGFFWIFGYSHGEPGVDCAAREGYGDGVCMLTVGLQLFSGHAAPLLFEYSFWHQVVDDPGDFFSFSDNHIVAVGVRL